MEAGAAAYAGFWRRYAASILDGVILTFMYNVYHTWAYSSAMGRDVLMARLAREDERWFARGDGSPWENAHMEALAYTLVVSIIMSWVYHAGFECSPLRGTPGKYALGLWVCDLSGQRIGFGRATGRHFGKAVSAMTLAIGYLMAGFTRRKQALHDMMAGCLVLRR